MRIAILGAAGRDFHNFLVLYRDDPQAEVVAFTATQIPGIEDRRFPPDLAGPRYPEGIPIVPEQDLERLALEQGVKQFVFSYSDVTVGHVASLAARANAVGADLVLPGTRTMLHSRKPVLGIGAVRTGCGKSQTTRYLLDLLGERGLKAVGIRHPMPYGDLSAQVVQRFASEEDLLRHRCTIEEREEYEPYIARGRVVYAGVDYARILAQAEEEADLILWDGGNNDLPFVEPDLHLVLMDPHRPGHARAYWPSEAQVRLADVVLISKSGSAPAEAIEAERALARELAPRAEVIAVDSILRTVDVDEASLAGRRVVCVEDGPTTTHGGMAYGAATLLARRAGAVVVDPRPHFKGEIAETYRKYPNIGPLVPAMGYSPDQVADLDATLKAVPADLVLSGTPIDLAGLVHPGRPIVNVQYDLAEMHGQPSLAATLDRWIAEMGLGG
ncbi:MAG: GTPase [Deltaproteobacteria bacterium]|nr:GTPase [Deltaproteobacteria bacterium]